MGDCGDCGDCVGDCIGDCVGEWDIESCGTKRIYRVWEGQSHNLKEVVEVWVCARKTEKDWIWKIDWK